MESNVVRIAAVVGGGLLALAIGVVIGLAIGGGSSDETAETSTTSNAPTTTAAGTSSDAGDASTTSTSMVDFDPEDFVLDSDVPVYGTPEERQEFIDALADAGVGFGSTTAILELADRTCYDLERLQEQRRPVAFAVRVVWNASLAEAESEELAAFGIVFSAAPFYLCPESVEYAQDVAYWLGF